MNLRILLLFIGMLKVNTAFGVPLPQFSVELLDENDGFRSSIVFSIVQDAQGFLWFGSAYDGLMRYDGKNIISFRNDTLPPYQIKHNATGNLAFGNDGRLWVGGWGSGLSVVDVNTFDVRYYAHDPDDPESISDAYVQEIFADAAGDIWLGTFSRGLNRFDNKTQTFQRFPFSNDTNDVGSRGTSHQRIWSITEANGFLWVATGFGLNQLNKNTSTFKHFTPSLSAGPDGINKIRFLLPYNEQHLLLGTQDGVLLFNMESHEFVRLAVEGNEQIGPVYSMINTRFHHTWIATSTGVYYFSEDDKRLRPLDLGIDARCAQTLFEDDQGIIWLSCEGKGFLKIIPHLDFNIFDSPIAKSAYSLTMAHNDEVLIGTQANGIFAWRPDTTDLRPITKATDERFPSVNRIMQSRDGAIWFTNEKHLFRVNADGNIRVINAPHGTVHSDKFNTIYHISEASDGRIWIGTNNGLFVLEDIDRPFRFYENVPDNPTSLNASSITEIYEDRQGRVWIGTTQGLNLWIPERDEFQRFYAKEHANTDQAIFGMYLDNAEKLWVVGSKGLMYLDEAEGVLEKATAGVDDIIDGIRFIKGDRFNNLWLVTHTALFKFNTASGNIVLFDKTDGLSGSRYFINLSTQAEDGRIFLSSRDGIHYFYPEDVKEPVLTRPTVLTRIEVLGKQGRFVQLHQTTPSFAFSSDENYLRFEFATLDYKHAKQIRYDYMLDGLDSDWIDNGNSNYVVYTNLNGGDYTLRVRPSIKNQLRFNEELRVPITIATPLWRTPWMIAVYVACFVLLVHGYIRYRNKAVEREVARQKEFVVALETQVAEKTRVIQAESDKLAAANRVKSQFLANMSHEIRTPLNVIIGLTEAIIDNDVRKEDVIDEVKHIHNNSRHLFALLNDILDVAKIEENKFEIEPFEQDIHLLLDDIEDMFRPQASRKGLIFNVIRHLPTRIVARVDGLRLKQVLINLCSNAIKFTERGEVTLMFSVHHGRLLCNLIDTGIGMSAEQLEKVFDIFTQGDNSISRRFGGSGLGLTLSKKIVTLMGGELTVTSELNAGSMFTCTIPLDVVDSPTMDASASAFDEALPSLCGRVLIADDHPDNRRLLVRLLERLGLKVDAAENGDEAIELYRRHHHDLLLLDIQMPFKDGIEAYAALRALGCRQPILALTANAMAEDIAHYQQLGFDSFLTKPIRRQTLVEVVRQYLPSMTVSDSVVDDVAVEDIRADFIARLDDERRQLLAASQTSHEALAACAHQLAGAAFLLHFHKIGELGVTLEQAARSDMAAAPAILEQLLEEMKMLSQGK